MRRVTIKFIMREKRVVQEEDEIKPALRMTYRV